MADAEESTDTADETTTEKGRRHENEAKDILQRVYGAGVEKVDAWGNSDPFGFVDIIAMQPGEPIKFVQVKTNGFTERDRQKYKTRTRKLPHDHAEFEVWVRHDGEGWDVYGFDGDEFYHKFSIDVCDTSKAREQYHEHVATTEATATDGGATTGTNDSSRQSRGEEDAE